MPTREELRRRLHNLINGKSKCRGPAGMIVEKDSADVDKLKEKREIEYQKNQQFFSLGGYEVLDVTNKQRVLL